MELQLFGDVGLAAAGVPELAGPEPMPLNHYLQNLISPRSRSEYDEFNRFHFSRLKQQGRDKWAVTPKVRREAQSGCAGGLRDLVAVQQQPEGLLHCQTTQPCLWAACCATLRAAVAQ